MIEYLTEEQNEEVEEIIDSMFGSDSDNEDVA